MLKKYFTAAEPRKSRSKGLLSRFKAFEQRHSMTSRRSQSHSHMYAPKPLIACLIRVYASFGPSYRKLKTFPLKIRLNGLTPCCETQHSCSPPPPSWGSQGLSLCLALSADVRSSQSELILVQIEIWETGGGWCKLVGESPQNPRTRRQVILFYAARVAQPCLRPGSPPSDLNSCSTTCKKPPEAFRCAFLSG